ncbi:YidB family protein [Spirochaetota bacterium]
MGFLDKMIDTIEDIKKDVDENDGILDELKDTIKQTGVGSTMEDFKKKGLGGTLATWISPDKNEPITKEQIMDIFGSDKILKFSKRSGLSEDEVSDKLTRLLPEIIDKSTPGGKIED